MQKIFIFQTDNLYNVGTIKFAKKKSLAGDQPMIFFFAPQGGKSHSIKHFNVLNNSSKL